ncbi:Tm-1-like ATP-binding domain-containing protein [Pelagibius sp. Alg239-R121]|uniref:Tm-1-like ATP-binding domain-containing protein n=1 Tax=Pelagibius sp. Alg239-R121 TaxID=2993448 RepID=UPI0024A699C0|nr:Tm-1-like ATP-binding domain-containing protein [Pelagibius sp. Alg239-R121]
MSDTPVILVIGTADTKSDELLYLKDRIETGGGRAHIMDVGVLGDPDFKPQSTKHDVAAAAKTSNEAIIALGDENQAMTKTAEGASLLARQLYDDGKIHGVLALGGTMGTDLALDVCQALPLGVPKYVVSTIAFSPLIPAERLAADTQMILWAGGLYGLNAICKSSLSQAAGAVVGAVRTAEPPLRDRPLVGITSLGKSCLKYMVFLKPALEKRGYEVAVFHTTGMGGRAFESLAAEGAFAAVMDFSLQELSNDLNGSIVTAGADRLENCGRAGIPQIVAPGAVDLIDLATAAPLPEKYQDREYHAHNRLIASVTVSPDERRRTARAICEKLKAATAPVHILLPTQGIEEWDRSGEVLYDPVGHAAFVDELQQAVEQPVELTSLACHINDRVFATEALKVFDSWVADGIIVAGVADAST